MASQKIADLLVGVEKLPLEKINSVGDAFKSKTLNLVSDLGKDEKTAGSKIDSALEGVQLDGDVNKAVKGELLAAWRAENPKKVAEDNGTVDAVIDGTSCKQDDKDKAKAALKKANLTKVSDLGDKPTTVEATARKKLADSGARDSAIDIIAAALGAAVKKTDKNKPNKTKEGTEVPDGRINIANAKWPEFAAERDGKLTVFKLPQDYVAKRDKKSPWYSAADLEDWQWLYLANKETLTKAYDIRNALDPANYPIAFATRPAFYWDLRAGFRNAISGPDAIDESLVETTVEQSRLHANMIIDLSVSGKYKFCSQSAMSSYIKASVDAQYKKDTTLQTYSKRVYVSLRWTRKKTELVLTNCLSLSPELTYILKAAFEKYGKDKVRIIEALELIFSEFGHYVPQTVTLGGVQHFEAEMISQAKQSTADVKEKLKAALEFKSGAGDGHAKVGYDAQNEEEISAKDLCDRSQMACKGGDDGLLGNIPDWKPTVDNSKTWSVIERSGSTSIMEIIRRSDFSLYTAIDKAIQDKRLTDWGLDDPRKLPTGWEFPPMPVGRPFSLCSMFGKEKEHDRSYVVAATDACRLQFAG
ncbi:hypothetical protein AC629_22390 [Bradyrhizobium sp. NAS80.1]|uniref:hypothetical protein n=1 Tax=Bradyrhizobium sp. NAS80.1 TaxID=1680159 RepID=UPI000961F010|nr:hypothetical protein [Bradyrhizobium sp. NAS80.1]OKO83738.1 hypothetical protein AC629_22390 [Bradyrhizobium sp. NAS80.1]